MPSNREMRERIDWAVGMFKELATKPYEMQLEVLDVFKQAGLAEGNPKLMEDMTRIMELPPEDMPRALEVLRGQLLVIKHDQFGD